jgi:hypothetical protein
MSWQLARVLYDPLYEEAGIVGKLVWANSLIQEPCGVRDCTVPSIGVCYTNESPFGAVDCVMHADTLELLPEFADSVPMIPIERWKQLSDDQVRALVRKMKPTKRSTEWN